MRVCTEDISASLRCLPNVSIPSSLKQHKQLLQGRLANDEQYKPLIQLSSFSSQMMNGMRGMQQMSAKQITGSSTEKATQHKTTQQQKNKTRVCSQVVWTLSEYPHRDSRIGRIKLPIAAANTARLNSRTATRCLYAWCGIRTGRNP